MKGIDQMSTYELEIELRRVGNRLGDNPYTDEYYKAIRIELQNRYHRKHIIQSNTEYPVKCDDCSVVPNMIHLLGGGTRQCPDCHKKTGCNCFEEQMKMIEDEN